MTNLLQLAERCEGADASMQGALLEEAWETMAEHSADFRAFATAPISGFGNNAGKFGMAIDAHAYESGALSLVPEDSKWSITSGGGANEWQAWVWPAEGGRPDWRIAATPALALCAAALRARAAEVG